MTPGQLSASWGLMPPIRDSDAVALTDQLSPVVEAGIQDGKWSVGLGAQIAPQASADLRCLGSTSGSQMTDSPWVQRRGSSQVANQSQVETTHGLSLASVGRKWVRLANGSTEERCLTDKH
jgi:hypothetical protein